MESDPTPDPTIDPTPNPTTDTIFTWQINNFEIIPNYNGLANVVKTVYFTYTGTYENYTAKIDGTVTLEDPNPINFAPYENLQQNDAINWITAKYDIGVFNRNIIEQIQTQITPPPQTIFGLPWTLDSNNNQ